MKKPTKPFPLRLTFRDLQVCKNPRGLAECTCKAQGGIKISTFQWSVQEQKKCPYNVSVEMSLRQPQTVIQQPSLPHNMEGKLCAKEGIKLQFLVVFGVAGEFSHFSLVQDGTDVTEQADFKRLHILKQGTAQQSPVWAHDQRANETRTSS